MKGLYNKIYNAINEGIQKALLIDPKQNDVSINYSYHKMNNNVNILKMFNDAVDEFIKEPNIANYNKVLTYSMNGKYQYKVNDFNELSSIFKKIFNITNNIDLSWVDTVNALTFIMDDGQEKQLNEINKKNVVFIKFNNIDEFNHTISIIIHKNLLIADNVKWCEKWKYISRNNNRKDGYENTYNNDILDNIDNYPAFKYCIHIKNIKKYQSWLNSLNCNYEAYLPAIDEIKFLSNNIDLINYILHYINKEYLNIKGYFWSSTQYIKKDNNIWFLDNGMVCCNSCIGEERKILPFFKIK